MALAGDPRIRVVPLFPSALLNYGFGLTKVQVRDLLPLHGGSYAAGYRALRAGHRLHRQGLLTRAHARHHICALLGVLGYWPSSRTKPGTMLILPRLSRRAIRYWLKRKGYNITLPRALRARLADALPSCPLAPGGRVGRRRRRDGQVAVAARRRGPHRDGAHALPRPDHGVRSHPGRLRHGRAASAPPARPASTAT